MASREATSGLVIADVNAAAYSVPIKVPLLTREFHIPFTLVSIETSSGLIGHGVATSFEMAAAMAFFINTKVKPLLLGENALAIEKIWQLMYSRFNFRGLNGFWSWATAAVDTALWDIKGKYTQLPIATLIGGAKAAVPTYVTFGMAEYGRDELIEVGRQFVSKGHRRLKMVVGGTRHPSKGGEPVDKGYQSSITTKSLAEDVARVRALREALGPDIEIMIDANCTLTIAQAVKLCSKLQDCDLSWFEEPVIGNHPAALHQLRSKTSIPIAAGQSLGLALDHFELMHQGSVDIAQPSVVDCGGFTECLKVAAMARGFGLSISNGGGWAHHNLHLHAGIQNGGYLEHHLLLWQAAEACFVGYPATVDGWMEVSPAPGLGFEPRPKAELAEFLWQDPRGA
jgi:L-rhamnonate dehydratase